MPFRSEPAEAAVGAVFGTLSVRVAVICTWSTPMPNSFGHHLRDLDVQALPHLGTAVIHLHRAVGEDVNQRASLVELHQRERDSELDGGQSDSLAQRPAPCVPIGSRIEPCNRSPPPPHSRWCARVVESGGP